MQCVQMPKQMALKHAALEGCGYSYEGMDHTEMCEFDIDDVPDEVAEMFPLKMSMRALPSSLPFIIIGQDECIFLHFLLTSKIWVGLHKESPLLPKSDGESQMISAFQSRDFGLVFKFWKKHLFWSIHHAITRIIMTQLLQLKFLVAFQKATFRKIISTDKNHQSEQ